MCLPVALSPPGLWRWQVGCFAYWGQPQLVLRMEVSSGLPACCLPAAPSDSPRTAKSLKPYTNGLGLLMDGTPEPPRRLHFPHMRCWSHSQSPLPHPCGHAGVVPGVTLDLVSFSSQLITAKRCHPAVPRATT